MNVSIRKVTVERVEVHTSKPFEDVLTSLYRGIGRPNMSELSMKLVQADSLIEFQEFVHGAVGPADLMEFLRIDLERALRIDPSITPYRIVRIIAGNPLIMKEMTKYTPDAGSYAPVTILVYEKRGEVVIAYDKMESLLAPNGSAEAITVARDLDRKVLTLLRSSGEDGAEVQERR